MTISLIDKGNATVSRQEAVQSCSGGCYVVDKYKELQSGSSTLTAYGVEIQIAELPVMVLDSDGLTVGNYEVPYTIVPAEYIAANAVVNIYKDGGLVEVLPAEVSSQGFIKFTSGSRFDVESKYEIEVVLNEGSSAEIRTERKSLMIGQVKIVSDEAATTAQAKSQKITAATVVDVNTKETIKELKYSRGDKDAKTYHILLMKNDELTKQTSCDQFKATLKTVSKKLGGSAVVPPGDEFPMATREIKFRDDEKGCISTDVSSGADFKFIITNMKTIELTTMKQGVTPLYGGIGSKLSMHLRNDAEFYNVDTTREYPIEPVGVFLIGIDGMRQDVLYKKDTYDVTRNEQSDGLEGDRYYVQPTELTGLCEVLGGKYDTGGCTNIDGMTDKHIKMKDVTAIFPSITLASWASIFTGKQPNETGIMGNEYFARDLIAAGISVPDIFSPPAGMVSYDSGSLKGFGAFDVFEKNSSAFFVPSHGDPLRTPQNTKAMLNPETVFEIVSAMPGVCKYFEEKGGDPVVSVLFHYARGAEWVTYSAMGLPFWFHRNESKLLDDMSWEGINWYTTNHFQTEEAPESLTNTSYVKRNDVPFPALTAWYLPGLDHDAHYNKGMEGYVAYFKGTIDPTVKKLVDKLKGMGEFDNKIFIVVADHGHTDMPVSTYRSLITGEVEEAEASCEFKFKDFGKKDWQKSEKANNNLHIWELAEMLRVVGKKGWGNYKVLTPSEISIMFVEKDEDYKIKEVPYGATSKDSDANVIAALNGPMAHIYLKDGDWSNMNANIDSVVKLAGLFNAFLRDGAIAAASLSKLSHSIDFILVRENGAYKLLNDVTFDLNGNVISRDIEDIVETATTTTFDTTKYVKAKKRIESLNSIRSGDIVLVFKDDTSGNVMDRYTSGVACRSWHGSLNPSDSYVPLIVSYPGGSNHEVCVDAEHKCSNLDIQGNWDVPAIIKSVLERQF